MKKLFVFFFLLSFLFIEAQEQFEGVIKYRVYENYSELMQQAVPGSMHNGAKNITFFVKDDKTLMVDSCLMSKQLFDPTTNKQTLLYEYLNKGIEMNLDVASASNSKLGNFRLEETNKKTNLNGTDVQLKTFHHEMNEGQEVYDIDAYVNSDYVLPETFSLAFNGAKFNGIPYKYIISLRITLPNMQVNDEDLQKMIEQRDKLKQNNVDTSMIDMIINTMINAQNSNDMGTLLAGQIIEIIPCQLSDEIFTVDPKYSLSPVGPFNMSEYLDILKKNEQKMKSNNSYPKQIDPNCVSNIDNEWNF